ncbi:MAG: hypothetical protein WC254_06475 [Candidatus Woesearchaeota archaeon]|jgi:hypothetical protein
MAVVGFTFTKMVAERKSDVREKVNISNNITVTNVEMSDLPFGQQKQEALKINFLFVSSFEPVIGSIELHGNLLYTGEAKELKEIAKNWGKDKKLPSEVMKYVLSAMMNKCNIQALILSRDVALPPPVPLPRISVR